MARIDGTLIGRKNRLLAPAAVVGIGLFALAACGGGESNDKGGDTSIGTPATPDQQRALGKHSIQITFDARPGKKPGPEFSNVIQVYPGPTESAADKQSNGTYMDGQHATATCKEVGRDVFRHPEPAIGEQAGHSNVWVRLGTPSGEVQGEMQFATGAYLTPGSLHAVGQLAPCFEG